MKNYGFTWCWTIFLLFLIFLLSSPPRVHCADEPFRVISRGIYAVGGYEIDVTGHQRGKILQLRGRVSYGPYCNLLRVSMKLENRDGKTIKITANVTDVGGGRSGLIREDQRIRRLKERVTDTWHAVDMKVDCKAK